ncbi:MAG: macro domain-containing protein [Anaerolineae bacterium]
MRVDIGAGSLELIEGDITRETTDAIVNAANEALAPGGGVDGAITRAAGPTALAARRKLGRCPTGEARIGPGGDLKARYIIYAVGPVYHGGGRSEAELLAGAYRASLSLAAAHGARSIAFPAISTGVYGYPMDEAAPVALTTIIGFLKTTTSPMRVRVVLFGQSALGAWERALQAVYPTQSGSSAQ